MNTRILLAGILGGIAMFLWSTLAHTVLPLGSMGVSELTNEQAIVAALRTNLGQREGLFLFPGFGLGDNPSAEAKHEAMRSMAERMANNPSGFLIYHPRRPLNMLRLMATEFATELVEAILAVFLLAQTRLVSFGSKVGFVTVIGIIVAIATNVSYWNWYGFPKRYTAAYIFIQLVGFLLVGLISALVVKDREVPQSSRNY